MARRCIDLASGANPAPRELARRRAPHGNGRTACVAPENVRVFAIVPTFNDQDIIRQTSTSTSAGAVRGWV